MSDRRRHRGPHPGDETLFADERLCELRTATSELSWLLSRGYASNAALALVGDRYQLRSRQRRAVLRCACAAAGVETRQARRVEVAQLEGRDVAVDGFNVLITIEAALSGGVVLVGLDGTYRDLSSVHGTYRTVEETPRALELLGPPLAAASNSGRLAQLARETAEAHGWPWSVELVDSPDAVLCKLSEAVVATSDGPLIDRCADWIDLPRWVIETAAPSAWCLDLRS